MFLGINTMIEYENTSHITLVVVVDGKLKVIAPKEKITSNNVVYIPSLSAVKEPEPAVKEPEREKKQIKKRNKDASKTED